MSGKLKIRVDQEKCQGHARCKSLAPELFDLDEFGNAHEKGDGSVPSGLEDKAWRDRTIADFVRIAELVEIEQFGRQRFAAGMSLALVLVDMYFQLSGHSSVPLGRRVRRSRGCVCP